MSTLPIYEDETFVQMLRSKFEGLDNGDLFFNNAAGAMRLRSVLILQSQLAQVPDYPSADGGIRARQLYQAMERGKEMLRLLIQAPDSGEIIQDLSASRLLFSLAEAAVRCTAGRKVITTELDHPASIDGVKRAAQRYGSEVIVVPVDQNSHSISVHSIMDVISDDVGVLMMTCTSNTTGAHLPYVEISNLVRRKCPNAFIILDGVQRVPHGSVNLDQCSADALVMAPYKVFGARGSGLAWVSDRINQISHECLFGQTSSSWTLGSVDPVSFGLMDAIGAYFSMVGGIVDPIASLEKRIVLGQEYVEIRERYLHALMLDGTEDVRGLRHIPGIQVWFDNDNLAAKDFIVSISVQSASSRDFYKKLLDQGIIVSLRQEGSIYCGTLLKSYGSGDVLRISPMHYNTKEEILHFLHTIQSLLQ